MNRTLIAAVDGSEHSARAALWAADETVRRGARLRLVHASPWLTGVPSVGREHDDVQVAAVRMLSQVRAEVHQRYPALAVEIDAVQNEVVDGLLSAARDAELLVLGSRGLGGFAGLLVGSTSLSAAARSDVPVVVVRPTAPHDDAVAPADAPTAGARIVVGVDSDHPVPSAVMEFAVAEAALRHARLHVVHGWDVQPSWSSVGWAAPVVPAAELQDAETRQLTRGLRDWRDKFPDTDMVEETRVGGGAAALVHASVGADLVVVGRRSRTHGTGLRLGPVAHAVLHHGQAPVAVVPHA